MKAAASPLSLTRALVASALFVVALGGFAALAWVTYAAIGSASAAQAEVGNISAESDTLRRLALQAASSKEARTRLSELAIPPGGNVAFIGTVESLGKIARAGMTVSSVSAIAPAGAKPGKLELSIRFSGSYAQSLRFVKLLETLPLSLSISELSLQHDGSSWAGTVSLSVLSLDTP